MQHGMRLTATGWGVAFLLGLSGCGVEVLTATAVQSELQAQQAQAIQRQVAGAANQSGRVRLEQAIRAYQAEKGAFPPSLDALVPDYLPAVPTRADGTPYGYDPARGILLDGPAASAGTIPPADLEMMNRIREAINRYGMATGYYPPTLDALYPTYLPTPPRTAAGEPFLYNNQNGEVRHPRTASGSGAAPGAPAGSPPPLGGAGPMGEVVTGIGMQQQLNSMSQSGTSAAQGQAAGALNDITGGHNQQQNRIMDQLGL